MAKYSTRGSKVTRSAAEAHFNLLIRMYSGVMVEPFFVMEDGSEFTAVDSTPTDIAHLDEDDRRFGWSLGTCVHVLRFHEARIDDGDLVLLGYMQDDEEQLTGVVVSGILFESDAKRLKRGKKEVGEELWQLAEAELLEAMSG